MSKRRQTVASVGIFVALAATLWTVPVLATDARKASAAGDKTSAASDMRTGKVSSAKRMAATHARSKPRLIRSRLARVASLYPTGCSWRYGGSCERQFPLIIGIGF